MPNLTDIFDRLRVAFGSLSTRTWWPLFSDADAGFEMLLGAILVQQTRWETVEGAIVRLHEAGLLEPFALRDADETRLAELLRPVAFYRQKAAGLRILCGVLCEHYGGDIRQLMAQPTEQARRELLSLPRIGNETADVTLLYVGGHAAFVVDEYTRRLFERVQPEAFLDEAGAHPWRLRYETMRQIIEQALDSETPAAQRATYYADYHALINEECVRYCLARPRCDGPPARRVYSRQEGRDSYQDLEDGCPLREICTWYKISKINQCSES